MEFLVNLIITEAERLGFEIIPVIIAAILIFQFQVKPLATKAWVWFLHKIRKEHVHSYGTFDPSTLNNHEVFRVIDELLYIGINKVKYSKDSPRCNEIIKELVTVKLACLRDLASYIVKQTNNGHFNNMSPPRWRRTIDKIVGDFSVICNNKIQNKVEIPNQVKREFLIWLNEFESGFIMLFDVMENNMKNSEEVNYVLLTVIQGMAKSVVAGAKNSIPAPYALSDCSPETEL